METASTSPSGDAAQAPRLRWWQRVVTVGLLLIAAAVLLPKVEPGKYQQVALLAMALPLFALALSGRASIHTSTTYRALLGLLLVSLYLHARTALLPDAWVPKNEWDEAWCIPWVSVLVALLTPFWVAAWIARDRTEDTDSVSQRSWSVASVSVVVTGLLCFVVLRAAYADAVSPQYTMGAVFQAVETGLVFCMAAALRPPGAIRWLSIACFAVLVAKATIF